MKYNKKLIIKRNWLISLACILALTITGCVSGNTAMSNPGTQVKSQVDMAKQESQSKEVVETSASTKGAKLKVHYIDVGQGNSVLIQSGSHFMLMDGGDAGYSSKTVSYLKKQGVKKLDYVIATHYDADHLNGVVGAMNVFSTGKVIGPSYTASSRVYQSFVSVMQKKNLVRIVPKPGKKYKLGKAKFTILAPNAKHYSDANDYSVAIRLTNGKNSFLLTGDAEIESEYEMLENGLLLKSDVYMTGHHGSRYSTSQAFMQAVKPKYAVISAGADNKYGHPAQEVMARLKAMGVKVYRTDEMGTVVAISNGSKITFNHKASTTWAYRKSGSATSIGGKNSDTNTGSTNSDSNTTTAAKGKYIGNVNSKKYHLTTCHFLPDKKNRVYFKTVKAAKKAGYSPCGICHPAG